MDTSQYVHADAPSDDLFDWTFYYTHHSDLDVPQYVSSVKKKKGSNITILKKGKKHYEIRVTNQLH
jgi:hypothetical protein